MIQLLKIPSLRRQTVVIVYEYIPRHFVDHQAFPQHCTALTLKINHDTKIMLP